jgi:hypothetical protein
MDWKRKLIWSIFTVTLIIPLISATIKVNIIPQTHASPDNTISIMPSNITDLGLAVDDTFAVNITVDYVELLWQWQFELTFNPDVIQGEWFDETEGYPVESDPYGFLESEGGTMIIGPGPGWNNTQGKLPITSASLLLKLNPVNGTGVLARATFRVVGKGETNITLTSNTALYNLDGIITTGLVHGYFRNVALAELPTASFTHSPVGTPEPLEGYYTKFNGTGSTATGVKTIDRYKWYFWANYSQRSFLIFDQIKLRPDGDGTYTDWTNNWDDWNETNAQTYVIANADAMYESSTLQNHTTQIYNIGQVRVTVVARNNITASDEKVQIMLVIGGTRYYGDFFNVTSAPKKYTSAWERNPATDSAWTWSDIDSLEAGVASVQNGTAWTGEIRISELYVEPIQPPIVDVDVDTIYQNITSRGPWKVSLSVTDSDGIVGTTTNDVTIKGHDVAAVLVTTVAPKTTWPPGMPYVEIDEIVPVNVTVENRGDFSEQHSPSSNFTVTVFYTATLGGGEGIEEGIIGTVNITTPLAAKANTTLTFQWGTSGRNITHPRPHILYANVTRVRYEYKVGDNLVTEETEGHRVRFHDVAITEVEVYPHSTLRPDGDGTFTDWTGTYEDWDDWPEHNGDTDYISVTADALNQSSTLEDHLLETWSIERVRVTIVARKNESASNARVRMMIAIGGEAYVSTGKSLTTSYSEYFNDWKTNPATGSEWTWQYVDLLEVGVSSYATTAWTGEARVTQLYVEVFGTAGPVSRGELAEVAVTVENEGDFSETDIDVTAYYDGDSIGTQTIYLLTNSSYGSGTGASPFATANYTIRLKFGWNTTGISIEDYTVSADISLVPDEYDPYDNTYVNGIMGLIAGPEPSTLSLSASPDNMTIGETTTLSGALTPALEGETINIQYRLSGAAWSDVASVLTDGSGQYSYEWTQTETAGNFQFKASWSGNADYLPAESIVITVVVRKITSTITITVDKTEIRYGDNLNFAGKITPVRASVSVTLWYKAGVADWEDLLSSFTTDENGEYTRTFGPNRAVTWQFKASWEGDAITEGAESDVVTVEVLPGERVDWTLPAVAVVAVIIVVVVAVYFLKFRKKS